MIAGREPLGAERPGPTGPEKARQHRRRRTRRAVSRATARRRRRLLAGLALVALLSFLVGLRAGAGVEGEAAPEIAAEGEPPPELPGGGRSILPERRIVALFGNPRDPGLGALGAGSPAEAARRLLRQARPYGAAGRSVLPAFELIAVVATSAAGADGMHRIREEPEVIDRYLRAARAIDALLILDVQPGRSEFMTEVEVLMPWLREPDVGIALDPEWRMEPGEVPGRTLGSTSAQTVNEVSERLAAIVDQHDLPDKLLIVHQFTEGMIRDREQLRPRPGIDLVVNIDGFGDEANKVAKYDELTPVAPAGTADTTAGTLPSAAGDSRRIFHGFKLFYQQDTGLMDPRAVLGLEPTPDVISYE